MGAVACVGVALVGGTVLLQSSARQEAGVPDLQSALCNLTAGWVSYNLPLVVTNDLNPWDALGDGTRRVIFERLVERPRAVGELADDLPVTRPAVSQHLRVLKDAGLVFDRAEGARRVYAINPAGLARLRRDLDRFWTQALGTFKTIAERPITSRRQKPKEKTKP